jgi:hypothetical protein
MDWIGIIKGYIKCNLNYSFDTNAHSRQLWMARLPNNFRQIDNVDFLNKMCIKLIKN